MKEHIACISSFLRKNVWLVFTSEETSGSYILLTNSCNGIWKLLSSITIMLVSKVKELTYLVCGTYTYVYIYILYITYIHIHTGIYFWYEQCSQVIRCEGFIHIARVELYMQVKWPLWCFFPWRMFSLLLLWCLYELDKWLVHVHQTMYNTLDLFFFITQCTEIFTQVFCFFIKYPINHLFK